MARGRKRTNLTIDEQIKQLEEKIKSYQEELTEMKSQLGKLNETKKLEEVQRLYDAVTAAGKTVDEVISQLNNPAEEA